MKLWTHYNFVMLSKTIPSICWGNNIIKEFPIKSKNKFPVIWKKQGKYILSIYMYCNM